MCICKRGWVSGGGIQDSNHRASPPHERSSDCRLCTASLMFRTRECVCVCSSRSCDGKLNAEPPVTLR